MTHPGEIRQNSRLYQAAGRIQDDDHSLLMGGIGLFAVPAAVMSITGKADWCTQEPGQVGRFASQELPLIFSSSSCQRS